MKLISLRTLATSAAMSLAGTAFATSDYGPAIWKPCCNANWYTSGNGHKFCVVHDMEGYYLTTVSYLTSCSHTTSSVFYAINGLTDSSDNGALPGEITQMVSESYYAWHAICWNTYAFGCEHEGFQSNPAWYTEAMYQASAGLYSHWCKVYGIARDRNHIVAHGEKSNSNWVAWAPGGLGIDPNCNTHTDPGSYWNWSHYMSLITTPAVYNPMVQWGPVSHEADGGQHMFVAGDSGQVFQSWQNSANGAWCDWNNLDGFTTANPSLVAGPDANGALEVFVVGSDGYVYHDWQTAPNGSFNGSWKKMGTQKVSGLCLVANADGRVQLFGSDSSGAVWTCYQTSPNGSWNNWSTFGGGNATGLVAIQDSSSRVFIFGVGSNGQVYRNYQSTANGSFAGWSGMGFNATQLAIGRNSDGRMELFGRDSGGGIGHIWQQTSGGWSSWSVNLSCTGSKPVVMPNKDGRLEIFYIGNDGNVWTTWQTSPSGSWSGITSELGTAATSLAAHYNQDGRIEVFWVTAARVIWHVWQTTPNGGWDGGASMGGAWRGL